MMSLPKAPDGVLNAINNLHGKKAAKALQGKYDDWKAYDKETENVRNLLKAEESIVQKKEAPLWWRKAQREKVEEIKEEIKTREKFSESFEMVIEDLISQYDQKIWSKEVRFKKRSFKRFKAFKKLHKALKTEYLKAAQDIPEEERLFDSDGEKVRQKVRVVVMTKPIIAVVMKAVIHHLMTMIPMIVIQIVAAKIPMILIQILMIKVTLQIVIIAMQMKANLIQ